MIDPSSPRKHIVPVTKQGVHPPHNQDVSKADEKRLPPNDPEDPAADATLQPDEQAWEYEDERSLREYIDDPDEPTSL